VIPKNVGVLPGVVQQIHQQPVSRHGLLVLTRGCERQRIFHQVRKSSTHSWNSFPSSLPSPARIPLVFIHPGLVGTLAGGAAGRLDLTEGFRETGLEVEVDRPLTILRGASRHLTIVYAATLTGGTFRPSAEVSDVRFVRSGEWPEGMRKDHESVVSDHTKWCAHSLRVAAE
jgi:hypothetical protein